jgi:ring-1,2-phenylacetyl-CoA epoxidase subunit PaaC
MYELIRLQRLCNVTWTPLANLAKRIRAEQVIHADHVTTWIEHLGNGTDDSKARMQKALDIYAPYASMMFEAPEGIDLLFQDGVFTNESCLFTEWENMVSQIANQAGLTISVAPFSGIGGRHGKHDDDFIRSLAELQEVFLTDPAAAW